MTLVKKFLPKSLFGRSLLILVVPMLLTQTLMAYVFYERHWLNVTRYMSSSLGGEIAYLVSQLQDAPATEKSEVIKDFERATSLDVTLEKTGDIRRAAKNEEFMLFREVLSYKIKEPFSIERLADEDTIEIRVKLRDQILRIRTTAKRIESPTTTIYLLWMAGSSSIFLIIATIFLRNQLRPISRLAKAAENFGRGIDTPSFRPHGANEIRTAARAFIVMRDRIQRQIRTRTDMLSGISHDLRTPLTRVKLQLALMGDNEHTRELADDVQQMEHMIAEYLDFARGEGGEEATLLQINDLLGDIVADYKRTASPITFHPGPECKIALKVMRFRRMLQNIIDNAIRYGHVAHVASYVENHMLYIVVDDEGDGIPQEMHDEVFRPFSRLDESRNIKTGGVGLGLTIARDVALSHGGTIQLAQSPQNGLRVIISLPIGRV